LNTGAWAALSQKVIAGFFNDSNEFERAYFEQSMTPTDIASEYRPVFQAIEKLYLSKRPVTQDLVALELGVAAETLDAVMSSPLWGESMTHGVNALQNEFARRIEAIILYEKGLARLQGGESVADTLMGTADSIFSVGTGKNQLVTGMKGIREQQAQKDAQTPYREPVRTWLSGIDSFLNGGMRPDRMIAIVGEEKSRKTTVLRNIYLHTILDLKTWQPRSGVSCGLLCFENNRQSQYYAFLAMLIVKRMIETQIAAIEFASVSKRIIGFIDSDWLEEQHRSGKYKNKPRAWVECVEYCIELLDRLPLFLYDRKKDGGRLGDVDSMKRVMVMHKRLNSLPTDLSIVAVDHTLLVSKKGADEHAAVNAVCDESLDIASDHDMVVFILSQISRAGKGAKAADVKVLSTKGSAKLEENAHNYMMTEYDKEKFPAILSVHQKLARSGSASNAAVQWNIHPPSGLIIN